jgi:magnesium transporter
MVTTTEKSQEQIQRLNEALASGTFLQVRQMLTSMPPADIAHFFESTPHRERAVLWKLINKEDEVEILQHLNDEVREQFLHELDPDELVLSLSQLDTDDLAEFLQVLPDAITERVLASMNTQDRYRLEAVLSYPENTAGSLINANIITVRPDITLDVVMRYVRWHRELPEMTDALFVVNRQDTFIGILPISTLLIQDPSLTVREAMITDTTVIRADTLKSSVAQTFERHDLISAPVIDEEGRLLGRITVDDIIDVIREEAEHSLLGQVGLDEEEDTFAPVLKAQKRRFIWLGINLLTAFLASSVIKLFSDILDKEVAFAVLMPIVASMGGIAGTQTLTIIVRGIALGQVRSASNAKWILFREMGVAALNGVVFAIIVGLWAGILYKKEIIGVLIAVAILINLLIAAIFGSLIPLTLKKLKIDPAIAGGVILTTVTDVIGFLAFLGLATLFY